MGQHDMRRFALLGDVGQPGGNIRGLDPDHVRAEIDRVIYLLLQIALPVELHPVVVRRMHDDSDERGVERAGELGSCPDRAG